MKKEKTTKTTTIQGITIDKVKPYQDYVATLHVKSGDKIVNRVVIFMKTKNGLVALKGYDENQKIYGEPNKLKINPANNTIRVATKQDLYDFGKHVQMVSMK